MRGKLRKGEIWTAKNSINSSELPESGQSTEQPFRMKHSNTAFGAKGHYYWLGCICLGFKSGGLRLSANGW